MHNKVKSSSQQQWFSSTFEEEKRTSNNYGLRHCRSDSIYERERLYSTPLEKTVIETVDLLSDSDDDILVLTQPKFSNSSNNSFKKGCRKNDANIEIMKKFKKQRISAEDKPNKKNFVSIIQEFRPSCIEQLAVHSKKIEEVRRWLTDHQDLRRRHKLLLLLGPCGTGKTATIRVLCNVLRLKLTEWESPNRFTVLDVNGEDTIQEISQVQVFEEFLKKANMGTLEKRHAQRLILIEQIPNVFYREPNKLHDLLRHYTLLSSCIFVFIMSVVDSSWYLNPKRIFPSSIISELHMDVISFNSTALTLLQKAVRYVLGAVNVKASLSQIKRIAESGNGDIRVTLSNLELCLNDDGKLVDIALSSSSSQTDTFHCIGKLLYAKRVESNNFDWNAREDLLSSLLLSNNCKRPFPLRDDVTEVINKSGLNGEKLALFIHEHEIEFCGAVESIAKVFDKISLMDSIFNSWNVRTSLIMPGYEAQVSARAVTFYNYGCNSQMKRLYCFHKAKWDSIKVRCEALQKDAYAAFPKTSSRTLFSLTLPLISVIGPEELDSQQWQVVTKIYSNSRFGQCNVNYNGQRHTDNKDVESIDNEEFDIEEIED
uniref:Cell cycle checkpoint protein RAD17 n=1 Tax=Syphacia muris TaxID=451379 RepID=A0A0N5AGB4_9BILA